MPSGVGQIRGDLGECCDFFGDDFLLIGFGSNEEFLQAFGALSGGLDPSDLFLQLPRGHPRQSPCAALRANLRFTIYALSCFVNALHLDGSRSALLAERFAAVRVADDHADHSFQCFDLIDHPFALL